MRHPTARPATIGVVSDTAPDRPSTDRPAPDADAAFAALGLGPALVETLDALGYEEPSPIQREAVPVLLTGVDVLGQAATGTGKTAAFALPLLQRHLVDGDAPAEANRPLALVLAPTRELAMQVRDAVATYGRALGVRAVAVFGGQAVGRQWKALERGVHVVVATPGRARDLVQRGALDLGGVRTVVLDEADEMLDMGFAEDIEAILDATPGERQTVLFSATMPRRITAIAEAHQRDPVRISVHREDAVESAGQVRQVAYVVDRAHKAAALARILDVEDPTAAIVFCRTRLEVDELTETLNGRNVRAEALHGGMDQPERDRVMGRLRDGTAEVLVATDVAARGLDVDHLTHVVNHDVPTAPEAYVHRIGRVGRAGRTGVAITLVEPRQRRLLQNIERLVGQQLERARIPTVDDVRASRVARVAEAIEAAAVSDDVEEHAEVLEALGDLDPRTVALAAIGLLREAEGPADEGHIPDAHLPAGRKERDRGRMGGRDDRGRDDRGRGGRGDRPTGDVAKVHVDVGREGGVRPADLVGAIANEAGLAGRDVGPIKILAHSSVVGVPAADVDRVIEALNRGSVRGKRVKARRFVE